MTLDEALAVLCGVHLRAFEFDGWHVEMGATPQTPWDREIYAPAWAVVRQHVLDARAAAAEQEISST